MGKSTALFAVLACGALATAGTLDTDAIRRVAPGAAIPMPAEVFLPAYKAKLQAGKDDRARSGLLTRTDEYLKTPAAVWRARMSQKVGYGYMLPGLTAPTEQYNATCPACLRPARFGKLDVYGYQVDYGWADHRRLGGTHRVAIGLTF